MDPDDDDVFEIPPPPHLTSRSKTKKQATVHDVIDIDSDEDSDDVVIIGEKQSKCNKGKATAVVYDGYGDHQVMEVSDYTYCQPSKEKFVPVSGAEFSINADDHGSDLKYGNDNSIDIFSDNFVNVDEYALRLQAHFDNVDIPTRIEAPINCLPEYDLVLNKTRNSTFNPWSYMLSDADFQGSTVGYSNFQIKMDNVAHYSGIKLSPQLVSHAAPSKKSSATSQQSGHDFYLSLGKESSKSKRSSLGSFHSKMKSVISDDSKNHGSVRNLKAKKLPHAEINKEIKVKREKKSRKGERFASSVEIKVKRKKKSRKGERFEPSVDIKVKRKKKSRKGERFEPSVFSSTRNHHASSRFSKQSYSYQASKTAATAPVFRSWNSSHDHAVQAGRSIKHEF